MKIIEQNSNLVNENHKKNNSCEVVAQLAFIAKEAGKLELSIMTAKALLSLVAWSG
jgi:hypothetical protein